MTYNNGVLTKDRRSASVSSVTVSRFKFSKSLWDKCATVYLCNDTGLRFVESGSDLSGIRFHCRPVIGAQQKYREGTARKILFAFHTFISSDKGFECRAFNQIQQLAIFAAAPPLPLDGRDLIASEVSLEILWHSFVEDRLQGTG